MRSVTRSGERDWKVNIPESWMQGRTIYGGLSASLCLQAVNNEYDELPPLRSAQFNFVGPAANEVIIRTKVLRQGKSVRFINAEISGEQGISTQATFCFGTSRNSKIDDNFIAPVTVPSPDHSVDLQMSAKGPAFTKNFDCFHSTGSLPISKSNDPDFHLWVRHKDQSLQDNVAILSIADMAPPAILTMFDEIAPVSSMTWMLNFLEEQPLTTDGWWLLNATAEHSRNGYSSQNMNIRNRDGNLVITGRQNIALFY